MSEVPRYVKIIIMVFLKGANLAAQEAKQHTVPCEGWSMSRGSKPSEGWSMSRGSQLGCTVPHLMIASSPCETRRNSAICHAPARISKKGHAP